MVYHGVPCTLLPVFVLVSCAFAFTPPEVDKFKDALTQTKLQAPTPDNEYRDFPLPHESEYFYMEGDYMVLTVEGNSKRSEVRCYNEFEVNNDTAQIQTATLRLPNTISDDEAYTWFQIHGEDTSLIRLSHVAYKAGYSDYLWASFNTGPSDEATHVDDGTRHYALKPHTTEDFSVAVVCQKGIATIYLNDDKMLEVDVSDWNDMNYFKAGPYVQRMSGPCYVEFRELGYPETYSGGTSKVSPVMNTPSMPTTTALEATTIPPVSTPSPTMGPTTRAETTALSMPNTRGKPDPTITTTTTHAAPLITGKGTSTVNTKMGTATTPGSRTTASGRPASTRASTKMGYAHHGEEIIECE